MSLFSFFTKLNHTKNSDSWIPATATFTGKRNKAAIRSKTGYLGQEYYEYEITYYTDDKLQRAWHTFFPLPDPEIEDIKDTTMKIRYNSAKPYLYEVDE